MPMTSPQAFPQGVAIRRGIKDLGPKPEMVGIIPIQSQNSQNKVWVFSEFNSRVSGATHRLLGANKTIQKPAPLRDPALVRPEREM